MQAIIFMLCLSLHNVEEALWLTEWQRKVMPNGRRSPQKAHFIFATIGITILVYLASGLHILFPNQMFFEYCFIGCVGAMLVNAFFPHVLATIAFRSYCPGVFTGISLLIPFNSIILYNAVTSHLKISEVLFSTLFVGLVLLGSIPLFESIAKRVLGFEN